MSSAGTISGTAAGGAPIAAATVTIKDANGRTSTTTTDGLGSYAADVTGLAAPFVIKVEGTMGGFPVVLHSLLDAGPATGQTKTANLTPITDAMVANIAGQDPEVFFQSPDKSKITAAAIAAAEAAVESVLAPVFTGVGLDVNSIDSIRDVFAANRTGLDKVLDSVQIQVTADAAGHPLVVLTSKADGSTATLGGSTRGGDTLGGTALPNIDRLDDLTKAMTTAMRSADQTALLALFDAGFMELGGNASQFLANSRDNFGTAGTSYGKAAIRGCNVAARPATCEVNIPISQSSGLLQDVWNTQVIQQADGSWKLYGDQHRYRTTLMALAIHSVPYDNSTPPHPYFGGLILYVAPSQASGAINGARLFVEDTTATDYRDAASGKSYRLLAGTTCGQDVRSSYVVDRVPSMTAAGCTGMMSLSDALVNTLHMGNAGSGGGIKPNPDLRLALYSDVAAVNLVEQRILKLAALPLNSAQFATAPFPVLSSASIAAVASYDQSRPLTLNWSQPSGAASIGAMAVASAPVTAFNNVGAVPVTQRMHGETTVTLPAGTPVAGASWRSAIIGVVTTGGNILNTVVCSACF